MKPLKRKQKFLIEMTAVVLVLMVSAAVMIPRFLEAQSFNTPEHFPDPVFRRVVEQALNVEPGGRFTREDISNVPQMELREPGIKSYKGLEHFTGLKSLVLQSPTITELDVSANVKLEKLVCMSRNLKRVNITRCEQLKLLNVNMTAIKELNLSGNPKLEQLFCIRTKLSVLDLSNNPAVTMVLCRQTPIHTLNLKGATSLQSIECSNTLIHELDLSTNVNLQLLNCSFTLLKELDVTQNTKLMTLQCNGVKLPELDVTQNPQLQRLDANGCTLKFIDLTKNPLLQEIHLSNNQLKEIPDFENCQMINHVALDSNQLGCEAWESLMQQNIKVYYIQYNPQYHVDLTPCLEDILNRTSFEYVQEMIQQESMR
jgi:hypothetical protein